MNRCLNIRFPEGSHSHVYLAVCPPVPECLVGEPLPCLAPGGPPFAAWHRGAAACLSPHAVIAGTARNGVPSLVGRARVDNVLMPARVDPFVFRAFVACGGAEHYKSDAFFEVLVLPRGRAEWVEATDGDVPAHAFPVCPMPDGETAFFARVHHNGITIPGRLLASEGGCVITDCGRTLLFRSYQVLAIM